MSRIQVIVKKLNIFWGTGVRKGLNKKAGANPAQSRYCNGERVHVLPLGTKVLGKVWPKL